MVRQNMEPIIFKFFLQSILETIEIIIKHEHLIGLAKVRWNTTKADHNSGHVSTTLTLRVKQTLPMFVEG